MNQNSRFFIILLTLVTGIQLQASATTVMTPAEKVATERQRRAAAKAHIQAIQQQQTEALARQQAVNAQITQENAVAANPKNLTLLQAAQQNNLKAFSYLITSKPLPNLNLLDDSGVTALMWAVVNGNLTMVQMLINAGANLNIKTNDGPTALSLALFSNQPSIALPLMNARASSSNLTSYATNPCPINIRLFNKLKAKAKGAH